MVVVVEGDLAAVEPPRIVTIAPEEEVVGLAAEVEEEGVDQAMEVVLSTAPDMAEEDTLEVETAGVVVGGKFPITSMQHTIKRKNVSIKPLCLPCPIRPNRSTLTTTLGSLFLIYAETYKKSTKHKPLLGPPFGRPAPQVFQSDPFCFRHFLGLHAQLYYGSCCLVAFPKAAHRLL